MYCVPVQVFCTQSNVAVCRGCEPRLHTLTAMDHDHTAVPKLPRTFKMPQSVPVAGVQYAGQGQGPGWPPLLQGFMGLMGLPGQSAPSPSSGRTPGTAGSGFTPDGSALTMFHALQSQGPLLSGGTGPSSSGGQQQRSASYTVPGFPLLFPGGSAGPHQRSSGSSDNHMGGALGGLVVNRGQLGSPQTEALGSSQDQAVRAPQQQQQQGFPEGTGRLARSPNQQQQHPALGKRAFGGPRPSTAGLPPCSTSDSGCPCPLQPIWTWSQPQV